MKTTTGAVGLQSAKSSNARIFGMFKFRMISNGVKLQIRQRLERK